MHHTCAGPWAPENAGGALRQIARVTARVLAAFLLLLEPVAHARSGQSPARTDHTLVRLESTTLTTASRWRTSGETVLTERRFSQDLRLTWTPLEPTPLLGYTHVGGVFDPALASSPEDPLLDERQLEPTLHAAWVRWQPTGWADFQIGRQLLSSPIGLARLDGARVRLTPDLPTRLAVDLALGGRPSADGWRLNDWSLEPMGDHTRRATPGKAAWLGEARLAWDPGHAALEAGVRGDRALDGPWYDRALYAGGRAGRAEGARLSGALLYHDLHQSLALAELHASSPTDRAVETDARLRWQRIVLPLDSPFAIYPLGASLEASAGAAFRNGPSLRQRTTHASLVARRDIFEGGPAPLALDAPTQGGLRVHHRESYQRLTHAQQLQLTLGPRERVVRGQHQLAWRGTGWRATLQTGVFWLAARSERSTLNQDALALSWSQSCRLPLGPWGTLLLQANTGVDNRPQVTFGTLALLDLHFPWMAAP